MNISKFFWVRLRNNISPIILLSIFQVWLTIEFPGHSFLETTANAILRPIFGVVGMISLIWIFTSDKMKDGLMFNIAPELDEPQRTWIKNIVLTFMAFAASFAIFFMYRKGVFNYSKPYYIISCLYGFFLYYFSYLAVEKRKKESQY